MAITVGIIPAVVLLMPLAVGTFDNAGLAQGGVTAALLALFGLTLLPLVELLLPPLEQPLGTRRAVLVPVAGIVLVLTLTSAGLAVDRVDAAHPRRANLAYVLDTDTGRASWVSRDAEPAEWTRRYVTERSESVVAGFEDGPVWTGPAPTVSVSAPEVTLRSRQSDTVELHVSSPRFAPRVVLRIDHRIDQVAVTAPGLATRGHRPHAAHPAPGSAADLHLRPDPRADRHPRIPAPPTRPRATAFGQRHRHRGADLRVLSAGQSLVRTAGLVVDLRSGAYAALAPFPDAVTIRVLCADGDGLGRGGGHPVNHHNKAPKGRLARLLATAPREVSDADGVTRIAYRGGLLVERTGEHTLDLIVPA